jgi:hypothetical protein
MPIWGLFTSQKINSFAKEPIPEDCSSGFLGSKTMIVWLNLTLLFLILKSISSLSKPEGDSRLNKSGPMAGHPFPPLIIQFAPIII